ncbi:MAG: hypothetical protein RBR47_11615, partial [Bacteroidales bacterium]|nr:hypothetical protein [Bacteroidales bacterium]
HTATDQYRRSKLDFKNQRKIEEESLPALKPISIEEFYQRIEAADAAYHSGNITSHQDLKQEIKTWGTDH